jgi:hypothetical protein
MMSTIRIFEGVEGLIVDTYLTDAVGAAIPVETIVNNKMFVIRPATTVEEEWATTLVAPNIIRHVVPIGANLIAGAYKIQHWIQNNSGYRGRATTVEFRLTANFK